MHTYVPTWYETDPLTYRSAWVFPVPVYFAQFFVVVEYQLTQRSGLLTYRSAAVIS